MAEAESLGILTHPFLTNVILPFLLIFVVVFAILERTELLGKGKKSANLLVALIIGILFIGVQSAVGFTLKIIPLVAMLIMILLCIYLIFGFMELHRSRWLQITLGIIFGIAFMVIVLWASNLLSRMVEIPARANTIAIITLMAALGAAIALVLVPGTKTS